jgi:hypothetical protein
MSRMLGNITRSRRTRPICFDGVKALGLLVHVLQVALRGPVNEPVELMADRGQLEPVRHHDQRIALHYQRLPTRRSHSISGSQQLGHAGRLGRSGNTSTAFEPKPRTPSTFFTRLQSPF